MATERSPAVHFPAFDGLRALAALGVAVTHAAFISGFNLRSDYWGPFTARLDVGVAVFFAISGFLLYRPFVTARFAARSAPAPRPYLRRRFLRIFPAYWVAFTLVVFLLPRPDDSVPDLGGLLAHYTLTHIYFPAHVLGPLQQSWSLATELSFYLLLPVYAWCLRSLTRSLLASELAGLVGLYALSVGFRALVIAGDWQPAGMYKTWLPARTDLFAVGMLLAVLSAWWTSGGRRPPAWCAHPALPAVSWALAGGAFFLVSKEINLELTRYRGPIAYTTAQEFLLQLLYGLTALFLLVPAVFGPQDRSTIRRFLQARTVAWLGLVSYGIYLWHEAAIDFFLVRWDAPRCTSPVPCAWTDVTSQLGWRYPFGIDPPFVEMLVFMLAATIAVAALSYALVERPALRLKDRPLGRRRPPASPEPLVPSPPPAPEPGGASRSPGPNGGEP